MITSGIISVGTTPTRIDGRAAGSVLLTLSNNDNTDAVYLGDASVTVGNGVPLLKLERLQLVLHPLEQIYVVSVKEGHTVSWIRQEN